MKKIALTSLLTVFAAAGAQAANVIDGNPLYMPTKGHFYSETAVESHSEPGRTWTLSEEFGYGITDRLAVTVGTDLAEHSEFDEYAWDNVSVDLAFRALNMGGWKADVTLGYVAGADYIMGGGLYYHSKPLDVNEWFNKDLTGYMWGAGVRGGYVAPNWTVAGHAVFSYVNSESFNFGDKGTHLWNIGLDAQYVVCPHLNLVAGVDYTGISNEKWAYADMEGGNVKNAGTIDAMFGVNYNIDATKYVGAYINGSLNHLGGDNADEWEWDDGFGFGAKFGIQF